MVDPEESSIEETRALLTETEREQIAGTHGQDRRYQATARVRARIQDELPTDIAILAEHHPELLDELRSTVCDKRQPHSDTDD